MSRRILIVDDNADLAETMSIMLGICGFDTATAYNGRRGVEKAREFRPEVVLLDIGLPDMNGYEAAARIRREGGSKATIIAISAADPDAKAPHAGEAGFNHYLIKPVDLDGLIGLISPSHA